MTHPTPEPGQIWADNDKRSTGRYLDVLAVHNDGYTLAKEVTKAPDGWKPTTKPPTRIRTDRFRPTSTGYRLIENTDGTPATEENTR